MNMLATAAALSDEDLLAHIDVLAGSERHASAELVAHLAVLHARPALFAAKGYGSLFSYCTQALRLSEDAACNRIEAAKACRAIPRHPRPPGLRLHDPHIGPDPRPASHA